MSNLILGVSCRLLAQRDDCLCPSLVAGDALGRHFVHCSTISTCVKCTSYSSDLQILRENDDDFIRGVLIKKYIVFIPLDESTAANLKLCSPVLYYRYLSLPAGTVLRTACTVHVNRSSSK
jgi:hypothetical protein